MKHEIESYVYQTTNYDWFKFKVENRDLKPIHIKKLEESISRWGQIQPIVVDNQGYVYEGQHRLTACKSLGVPVKYIINTNAGLYTMQAVNSDQKAWTLKEHILFHAKTGKHHYQMLQQLSEKYKVSINYLAEIAGNRTNDIVRKGEFKSDRWDIVKDFLEFHKKIRPHIRRVTEQGFMNGMFFVWCLEKVDDKRLFQKMFEHRKELDEFSLTKTQAKEKLIEIYNENLKSDNRKILYFYNAKKELELEEKFKFNIEEIG